MCNQFLTWVGAVSLVSLTFFLVFWICKFIHDCYEAKRMADYCSRDKVSESRFERVQKDLYELFKRVEKLEKPSDKKSSTLLEK